MEQLIEAGVIQVFHSPDASRREPILGAVGELQFDVVRFRLESEYNAQTAVHWQPYEAARWLHGDPAELAKLRVSSNVRQVIDGFGRQALLFPSQWDADYCARDNPNLRLTTISHPEHSGR